MTLFMPIPLSWDSLFVLLCYCSPFAFFKSSPDYFIAINESPWLTDCCVPSTIQNGSTSLLQPRYPLKHAVVSLEASPKIFGIAVFRLCLWLLTMVSLLVQLLASTFPFCFIRINFASVALYCRALHHRHVNTILLQLDRCQPYLSWIAFCRALA